MSFFKIKLPEEKPMWKSSPVCERCAELEKKLRDKENQLATVENVMVSFACELDKINSRLDRLDRYVQTVGIE